MFRRRRGTPDEAPEADEDLVGAEGTDEEVDDDLVDDDEPEAPAERSNGPWDVEEVDLDDDVERIDLGSVHVPGRDGLEIQVQMDEASGTVIAVTAVLGESAVQIQPFAAPRTMGIWSEVRQEIRSSVNAGGGLVDEVSGPFGPELRTRVPTQLPDGTQAMQPARFVGVDGPRWFLRGVFLGQAATDPSSAGAIEDVFRNVVVVRGREAMAPKDPLPITLPVDPDAAADDEDEGPAGRPPLSPFERGPEITEIR